MEALSERRIAGFCDQCGTLDIASRPHTDVMLTGSPHAGASAVQLRGATNRLHTATSVPNVFFKEML